MRRLQFECAMLGRVSAFGALSESRIRSNALFGALARHAKVRRTASRAQARLASPGCARGRAGMAETNRRQRALWALSASIGRS
ncbi:hypothetical protein WT08_00425 [Burkholderia sp. MSMB1552]|nr:hypothetical protein AQ610_24280 [Burkholderia humptydooensis]KVN07918.1 hypothetical protein WT08_00425 [Burkholderia sp. MSMB1552]KWZ50785.1 hypothetical protein WS92_25860 [Burkholderia sp. MSMB1588]